MGKFRDLTGQRYGKLTVIGRAPNKGRRTCWFCKCDCGKEVVVLGESLSAGKTQSCGCLQREAVRETGHKNTTHGMTDDPNFRIWGSIKARCFNPKNKHYKDYGGRGITIYPAWVNDFKAFYDYVSQLEHFGEEGYTLDRIKNDKNYEPGNLRFATKSEQARNRRNNVIVEYKGQKMSLPEAAEKSGINYGALRSRYYSGDRGERLFRPVKK